MLKHEAETWREDCKLLLGGAVVVAAGASVWAYDGRWGGEVVVDGEVALSEAESAVLLLDMEGEHPVQIKSVSHRGHGATTVHFVGYGPPPFSPHAIPMQHGLPQSRAEAESPPETHHA